MNSRLLAGLAAGVAALIGLVLVFSYAQGADARARADLEPVPTLVVTKPIMAGTPVESLSGSVESRQLPRTAVPQSAVASMADHSGKVAAADLVVGETLLTERLVPPAELKTFGTVEVPEGLQEVTFEVAPVQMVGGNIGAGDTVGFFATFDKESPDGKTIKSATTQRVHHKILVTNIQRSQVPAEGASASTAPADGQAPAQPDPTAIPTGTGMYVTVAVDDDAAQKIIFAAEFGRIWLTKEPAEAKEGKDKPTTIEELYP